MGGVCWKGGSQELAKPTTTTQLKMENTCILCNVIKVFTKKGDQSRKMKASNPFNNGIGIIL
jgi:hypothetical protein